MDRASSGGVDAAWDAARGILRVHMLPGCAPTREDANRIADAVEAWTGLDAPIRVLVDCEGATGAHVGWRVGWTMRITKHGRKVRLAYHNARQMSALVMPVFAYMSGIEAKVFPDAAQAEAWLAPEASAHA